MFFSPSLPYFFVISRDTECDCKNNAGSDARTEVHSDFKFNDFKESEHFSFFLPISFMTKYLSGSFFVPASLLNFL